jgi:hypothetical protein
MCIAGATGFDDTQQQNIATMTQHRKQLLAHLQSVEAT